MDTSLNSQLCFFLLCYLQYDDLESSLRDSGVLVQTQKTENLEVRWKTKGLMRDDQIWKCLKTKNTLHNPRILCSVLSKSKVVNRQMLDRSQL